MLSSHPFMFASTIPEGGAGSAAAGRGATSDAGGASVSLAVLRCGLGGAVSVSVSVPVSSCWALALAANEQIEQAASAKARDRRAALLAFINRHLFHGRFGLRSSTSFSDGPDRLAPLQGARRCRPGALSRVGAIARKSAGYCADATCSEMNWPP